MKKTAKPAAKKAPKKPMPVIIIGGKTAGAIGFSSVADLIAALPTSTLKELLRARDIGIPKSKALMVARLANWAVRSEATFILSLR